MQRDASTTFERDATNEETSNLATPRARERLTASIAAALEELIRDCEGIDGGTLQALSPVGMVEDFLACAEGVSLNLRGLESGARGACYADAGCAGVLVAKRLPDSAWRDLQSVCRLRFSELALPDLLGSDTSLPAFRGLKGLRSISMALDPGARTVDLRGLSDLGQPLHVEIRCRSRQDIDVLAPEYISVSAEIEGELHVATCRKLPASDPGSFGALAKCPAVHYRLSWDTAERNAGAGSSPGGRMAWSARLRNFLSMPIRIRPAGLPVWRIRDECFASLEDALAAASGRVQASGCKHDIREHALQVLANLNSASLDLASFWSASSLVIAMDHEGWHALDTYSNASYGHGIRQVRLPAGPWSQAHAERLHANLEMLPDLRAVFFGSVKWTIVPRAADAHTKAYRTQNG